MSAEDVSIVRRFYEAFGRRGPDAARPLMDPGVSLCGPPVLGLPYSGFHSGPGSVTAALFKSGASLCSGLRLSLQTFLDTGESVAVQGFFRGVREETGEPLREPFFHECFVQDGKISRIHSYPEAARLLKMPD